MTDLLVVCVPVAVAAAALNAAAALLQASAARRASLRPAWQVSLLAELVRRPRWLLGLAAAVVAFLCQATALAFGPVTLVQPILVTSLLIAVLLRSWGSWRAQPVVGALVCAGGLAVFLALTRPAGGTEGLSTANVFPLAPALLTVLVGSLLVASRRRGNARAVPLALSAGVLYGVTAGLTELVTRQLAAGPVEPLRHWQLYVAFACGVLGVQLNQAAFQTGTVPAAVAVITATDPAVSIAVGVSWLGEHIDTSAALVAGEAVGFAAMVAGIAVLARETPAAGTR